MSRPTEERAKDILEAIARCQRYVARVGTDKADTELLDMAEDAIERNLQVIGEAVAHLPPEVLAAHPNVPWPQIRGFRNILVHHYFGVDLEIVRDVVDQHLPHLAAALQRYRDD